MAWLQDGTIYATRPLKSILQEEDIAILKTHDLGKLLDALLPSRPLWEALRPTLDNLTVYAIAFRYPGETADKEEARVAMKLCRAVRETLRLSLGLPIL